MKQVIALASRYGFNRLHWHLTDDQGWRFEVPEYPRLTAVGGYLQRGRFDDYDSLLGDTRERAITEAAERWTSGYYSDDEIHDIVEYATVQGIVIVPEVDLPGHMAAAIEAYPELGRPVGLPLPTGSMRDHMWWPARNDLLWPTDAAREFVTAVMTRIAELFPGQYVHIGGDECAYRQWSSDPTMTDQLAELGLGRVEDLQVWFMDVAARALQAGGKSVAVWDEACEIWDRDDVLVVAWDEERGMDRVARATQQFVFADARTLYLNRIDPNSQNDQKGMLPGISVEDILTAPWELATDDRCVGIQACVWSEFVLDGSDLMSMLMPRLLAVAERMWNPDINPAEASVRIQREVEMLTTEAGIAPGLGSSAARVR
jgi:hexosaminidase